MAGTMNAMSSWLDALQLLSKARQAAHEDIVAFNQLVSCLGRVAHWRRGLDVLRCGLAQRLEATRVTYNATSSSFEKASRWQRLLFSLEHMAKSTSMANSALTSCASEPLEKRRGLGFTVSPPAFKMNSLYSLSFVMKDMK